MLAIALCPTSATAQVATKVPPPLHAALDRYGIANRFAVYPGTHTSDVAFRFQDQVIPFFARELAR